jgi:hypothetical protein
VTLSKQDILRLVMEGFGVSQEYTTAEIISTITDLLTPQEPTGRLALVEDVEECVWIKSTETCWSMVGSDLGCDWKWLNQEHGPVNILFRGIERP